MRQTDFCTASCIWDLWRNSSPDIKKEEVIENTFKSRTREYLPHSFCLHLAVVTKDEKVVVTTISRFKENDYAKTKAVTIGEQIEGTDFYDNVSFHSDAVERWTRRALSEEMGIDDSQYTSMTSRDSIHVLSINFEGDIYNFSLMAVLDIHLTYDDFVDEVCRNPARDKEFNTMEGLDIIRIPEILRNSGKEDERNKFHPSSLLRMYLVYIHYYGIKKFVKEYERHPDTVGAH